MASLKRTPAWKALKAHHREIAGLHMRDLFDADPRRFERLSLSLGDFLFDYSKNRITERTMALLLALARQADVEGWRERMFAGRRINTTEDRAVLHPALRAGPGARIRIDGEGEDVMEAVGAVLGRMRAFTVAVRGGIWKGHTGKRIRDVVNLGIGGSDLGPAMATEALTPYHHPEMSFHFVSNVDGTHIAETLRRLDPEGTLFIVASKTFTTQETLANARSAREWLVDALGEAAVARHFVALSTNPRAVRAFGIEPANMFELWDWVGGRYSLWSAIGMPIALAVGIDRFEELLAGARVMDEHFLNAPLEANMPVVMALIGVWNTCFLGVDCHAVLPYDQYLARLPAYLQQAEMESNGKRVTRDGVAVDYPTAPVLFGEAGTNGQHSFYQLIHQSPRLVSCDFIAAAESHNPIGGHHRILMSNFLAQTEALMRGRTEAEARAELAASGLSGKALESLLPHKVFEGNRPTNSILVRRFDPRALGMLIALYEHRIFVQGVIWRINSFDQWGVELGKQLAVKIQPELEPGAPDGDHDSSTRGLIAHYRRLASEAP